MDELAEVKRSLVGMIEAYHKLSDENSRLHQQLVETQRLYKECEEFKESLVEDVKRLREAVKTLKLTEKQWAKFYAALEGEHGRS